MRSLNLDQLRALTEVVACGSFSAAARRLNLTQPAVSLQVRELEARFGVQLIERLGKQAHPTVPGQQLVEMAQRILQECDAADTAMRQYRKGWLGQVRIGTMLTVLTYRLPPILQRLRAEHPDIVLIVNNMPTLDAVTNVLENKIDLGVVTLPIENRLLRVTPILEERLVAILPTDVRDAPKEVTPEYVAGQTLLTEHIRSSGYRQVIEWLGKRPMVHQPMPIGTVEAVKTSVAAKLGMGLVPEVSVMRNSSDLIMRPLKPPIVRELAIIEHRNKVNDAALEIVREALLGLRTISEPSRARKPTKTGAQ
jgi:DNA-binding transcriptional LysR family regulator